jgi:hypothetical protein
MLNRPFAPGCPVCKTICHASQSLSVKSFEPYSREKSSTSITNERRFYIVFDVEKVALDGLDEVRAESHAKRFARS